MTTPPLPEQIELHRDRMWRRDEDLESVPGAIATGSVYAFNAEVFVAAPHAVAMEFDLFGERRSGHWVKGGGVSKRELLVG